VRSVWIFEVPFGMESQRRLSGSRAGIAGAPVRLQLRLPGEFGHCAKVARG
jgi:hypothetical protein